MQISKTAFLLSVPLMAAACGAVFYVASTGSLPELMARVVPTGLREPSFTLSSDVEVSTDRLEYQLADLPSDRAANHIQITVKNPLDQDVLSPVGSMTSLYALEAVQKKTGDGKWERLFAHCEYPNCRYMENSPVVIASQESRSFKWKPVLYVDGTVKEAPIGPGSYRVLVRYQLTKGRQVGQWLLAASNEFSIR